MNFWTILLTSNEAKYRLLRTIIQGIIGVVIANADMLVSHLHISADMRAFIVALVMAILSPLMAELGDALNPIPKLDAMAGDEPDDSEVVEDE